jgi:hypothetical protein
MKFCLKFQQFALSLEARECNFGRIYFLIPHNGGIEGWRRYVKKLFTCFKYPHLKRAGVFMNNSVIEVVASQTSLWRIAL